MVPTQTKAANISQGKAGHPVPGPYAESGTELQEALNQFGMLQPNAELYEVFDQIPLQFPMPMLSYQDGVSQPWFQTGNIESPTE